MTQAYDILTSSNGASDIDPLSQLRIDFETRLGVACYAYRSKGFEAICREMRPDEFEQVSELMQREHKGFGRKPLKAAAKAFVLTCVHPTGDDLATMMRRKPGLAVSFGGLVLEEAGLVAGDEVEKF